MISARVVDICVLVMRLRVCVLIRIAYPEEICVSVLFLIERLARQHPEPLHGSVVLRKLSVTVEPCFARYGNVYAVARSSELNIQGLSDLVSIVLIHNHPDIVVPDNEVGCREYSSRQREYRKAHDCSKQQYQFVFLHDRYPFPQALCSAI